MPNNRHTKQIRKLERKQIEHQEGELAAIERRLRKQEPDLTEVPVFNQDKVRRSARLERKRQLGVNRRGGANDTDRK